MARAARSVEQQDQVERGVGGRKTVDRLAYAVFVYGEVRSLQHPRNAIAIAVGHDRVNRNQVGVEPDRSYLGLFALSLFVLRLLRSELRDEDRQGQPQRHGDTETEGQGDWAKIFARRPVALSPCRPVLPFLHLSVFPSMCLCGSVVKPSFKK